MKEHGKLERQVREWKKRTETGRMSGKLALVLALALPGLSFNHLDVNSSI